MTEDRIIIAGNKFNNIITSLCGLLIIGLVIVGFFVWKDIHEQNISLQNEITEFKKLTNTLVRSSTKWVTKNDLNTQLENLLTNKDLEVIKNDMKKINSKLIAVGKTVGNIKNKIVTLEKSDNQGPVNTNIEKCEDGRIIDTHEYTKRVQLKEIIDSNKAPLAKIEFNAAVKKPWSYEVYKRDYQMSTIVGKKDSGQLTFHHELKYSIPNKDPNKKYEINLESSDYLQVKPHSKMFWMNPIVDVNFFAGGNVYGFTDNINSKVSIGTDIGLSLSSYGDTEIDSWFRLFRFGIGYDAERRAGHFSFAPFAFNLGKPLPLITNMYLTPQVAVDTGGGLIVGLGIGPQF